MSFLDKTQRIFPAYGRKYKNKKEFKEDWFGENDFQLETGQYMTKLDVDYMITTGIQTLYIKINHVVIYLIRFGKVINKYE